MAHCVNGFGGFRQADQAEKKHAAWSRRSILKAVSKCQRGGHAAAILSSLTSTCRRHSIDTQRYLTQLLTNLPATSMTQLVDWLPDQWKVQNPVLSA
jgi:hypothetical protein